MKKKYFTGKGQGISMQPMINEADRLHLVKIKAKELKLGDIVVFHQHKRFIAHRLIGKKESFYLTKGDNVPFFDKPLQSKDIIGKVVQIEGKYGKLNLTRLMSRLFNYYFLCYSLATYYLPDLLRTFLIKSLRGRKILVKLLASS